MTLWLVRPLRDSRPHHTRDRIDLDAEPCPTVAAANVGGVGGEWWVEDDGRPPRLA